MVLLIALSALAVAAIVATLVGLARDGYRAAPTEPARVPDRSLAPVVDATARSASARPVRVRRAHRVGAQA